MIHKQTTLLVILLLILPITSADLFNLSSNPLFDNQINKDFNYFKLADPQPYHLGMIKQKAPSIKITLSNNDEVTMILYANGSFWIKNGTEQYNGEQLAKVAIAYSSYQRGYCERLLHG